MTYRVRPADAADIPSLVRHREQMFREMGTVCEFAAMAAAFEAWLRHAVPAGVYRAWVAETDARDVVAGGGLIVMPWSPGPTALDPRLAFVFNVYTEPPHRGHGLARQLMETMHQWCRTEGICRLALNASAAGQPIYERMGYVSTPEPMMRIDL